MMPTCGTLCVYWDKEAGDYLLCKYLMTTKESGHVVSHTQPAPKDILRHDIPSLTGPVTVVPNYEHFGGCV